MVNCVCSLSFYLFLYNLYIQIWLNNNKRKGLKTWLINDSFFSFGGTQSLFLRILKFSWGFWNFFNLIILKIIEAGRKLRQTYFQIREIQGGIKFVSFFPPMIKWKRFSNYDSSLYFSSLSDLRYKILCSKNWQTCRFVRFSKEILYSKNWQTCMF